MDLLKNMTKTLIKTVEFWCPEAGIAETLLGVLEVKEENLKQISYENWVQIARVHGEGG